MRKISLSFLIVLLTFVIAACGSSNSSRDGNGEMNTGTELETSDEIVKIKIADSFPTTHVVAEYGVRPWIERIEELGAGKIEIEYFPAEQLGDAGTLLNALRNNLADITYLGANYLSDQLPLSGVVANAGMVTDSISGTKAYHKLIEEHLYELEFQKYGVKPLWSTTLNAYQIASVKDKKLDTVDSLKGVRFFSTGGIQEVLLSDLGGTAVTGHSADAYSLMERGTVDASLMTLMSWPGYQLHELAKSTSTNASLGSFGIIYAVNETVWNSWPEDVQNIVLQASEEVMEYLPQAFIDVENELQSEYEAMGVEFYEIVEDELEKMNELALKSGQSWAESMDRNGLSGTEVFEKFQEYNIEFQQ